ncbi:Beta-1,3-galactosyltransferase 6 [Armadillidium vulgare]|nr:Beta-1,3-galactosyltransferase 6 [Armadillidium vulgare]
MQHRSLPAFLKRKITQNLFFITCCGLSFLLGNFMAAISLDPTNCSIKTCAEKIKQTDIDDQLIQQWEKSPDRATKTVFLVILIVSSPTNQEQRDVIRETWLSDELVDTVHFFAIGTHKLSEDVNVTIQSEQKKFKDLLLLNNLEDSYHALPRKILASFIYVHFNVKYRFLLKVDDDSYVNLPKLHQTMKSIPYKQRLYWGFFDGRATPLRRGQWKESDWILCDRYIPYALGGGYILSDDLVSFIALNYKFLKIYKNEDVSIGTWLAPVDVHRYHDPRFDTEYKSRGCKNEYIVTHKQNIIHMREKFNSLRTSGLLCKKEFTVRKSYQYNWNVPPSMCCYRNNSSIP